MLALLCGVGAAALMALFLSWLLRPGDFRQMRVVVSGRGEGERLEALLQWLAWLRRTGLFRGEAVIWDAGLTPAGRELALELTLRWNWVALCPRGGLEKWLEG